MNILDKIVFTIAAVVPSVCGVVAGLWAGLNLALAGGFEEAAVLSGTLLALSIVWYEGVYWLAEKAT